MVTVVRREVWVRRRVWGVVGTGTLRVTVSTDVEGCTVRTLIASDRDRAKVGLLSMTLPAMFRIVEGVWRGWPVGIHLPLPLTFTRRERCVVGGSMVVVVEVVVGMVDDEKSEKRVARVVVDRVEGVDTTDLTFSVNALPSGFVVSMGDFTLDVIGDVRRSMLGAGEFGVAQSGSFVLRNE